MSIPIKEAARSLLQKCDINILHEVASDGASSKDSMNSF